MEVEETCCYNGSPKFPYCGIIVKINDPQIKEAHGNKTFLLQLWSRENFKAYEISLKGKTQLLIFSEKPLSWECHFRTLVYIPAQADIEDGVSVVRVVRLTDKDVPTTIEVSGILPEIEQTSCKLSDS